MKKTYLGAVCEGKGSYGIVFRDFPGCVSAGDTLEEVLAMGLEALQGHVEVMVEHGDFVPEPTAHRLTDVKAWLDDPEDPDDEQWVGLYPIEVNVPAYPETIAVPVRSDLVREIDEVMQKNREHLNASRFIENAARRELERLKKSA
jgi:predicted RNase H-like HicB family nuclease